MGMEANPFLHRVEVVNRRQVAKAVYREAFFEGLRLTVVRCGIGPERAAASIRALDEAPRAIILAGIAGGLVEGLRVGEMVIASETVFGHSPSSVVHAEPSLVSSAARACLKEGVRFRIGRIATVREPVFERDDRASLHTETRAHVVDMESHSIALEAARLGVPFTCIRVVSDDMDSPPLPTVRSFKKALRNPAQLPGNLLGALRWWSFLRRIQRVVLSLDPILVKMVREQNRQNES